MSSKTELMNIKEDKLLQQLSLGDENALKQVYRQYFKSVLHLVTSNSGNQDDAKDVYQDAICVLYDNVRKPDFSITCSLSTYIYSIARNLWLKELRNRNNGELRIKEGDDYVDHDSHQEVNQFLVKEKRVEVMNDSLDELGEPCKSIITDFFFHKLSMEEIAHKMGYTNAENAKNQKYKCFVRLKKIFMVKNNKMSNE